MDWIAITCWVVLGVSGLVTLWALFWDRPRGRLRCRRCAYDMSGGGLTCPECGREHKAERSLRKTRRKWKTGIAAALLFTIVAYINTVRLRIEDEGAIGLVPSIVLVAVADPQDYLESVDSGNRGSLVTWTLNSRLNLSKSLRLTRRLWIKRVAEQYQSEWALSGQFVQAYDLSDIAPPTSVMVDNWSNYPLSDSRRWSQYHLNIDAEELLGIIQSVVDWECWYDNGGDTAASLLISDQLLVAAPQRIHELVRQRLADLRNRKWRCGQLPLELADSDQRCLVVYAFPDFDGLGDLEESVRKSLFVGNVELSVRPHLWQPDGYGAASLHYFGDSHFTIWTTPAHHREIMTFLNSQLED